MFVFSYIFKKLCLLIVADVSFQLITFHSTSVATNYIFVPCSHFWILCSFHRKMEFGYCNSYFFYCWVSEFLTSFYEISFQKLYFICVNICKYHRVNLLAKIYFANISKQKIQIKKNMYN